MATTSCYAFLVYHFFRISIYNKPEFFNTQTHWQSNPPNKDIFKRDSPLVNKQNKKKRLYLQE